MNDIITNGTEIKQRILSEINNAMLCVNVAMAYFTDRDIAMAIIGAKNRNVSIDIILSSNVQNDTVKLMFKGANISVHAFETGDARGIMHHKFCLIDNSITINGSYNYSINASNNNVENIHVSDDQAIYSQFLSEFERLKFNIDNNIGVNENVEQPAKEVISKAPTNIIDTFSQRLHNLVYTAAQIDTAEYRDKGYEASKDSGGSFEIYRIEYSSIKQRIRTYAIDEGLGSMRNVLNANITQAYESTRHNLEIEKEEKINVESRSSELEKRQLNDKITELKSEKAIWESGNQNTGERGLFQVNKEIEKNRLEKDALEQSFVVKKFWSISTVLVIIGLSVFIFYLSVFFASAVYKVFFEGNIIRASLEAGINPGLPQLVDANAIIKIFRQQGFLFGIIAALFFLIPILLSNLKILGSENKVVNRILFWNGLVVFDILVSTMVALNTDEIKSLLVGKESTLQIWEVIKHGEFWLIFVFGMFPLILTHFLIDYLSNSYKKSQRDIVDGEKNRKIQFLENILIDLNAEKSDLNLRIKAIDDSMADYKSKILNFETSLNHLKSQIENRYSNLHDQIRDIFDDYTARITSGRIFSEVILCSVVSAFKSGFIEYLPVYYSTEQVTARVKEIDQISDSIN